MRTEGWCPENHVPKSVQIPIWYGGAPSSRSRDRRRRSDRGRSRRSRTPERSERSQPSSLPPPPAPPVPPMVSLPVPSPGFVWQQVPVAPTNVHAGTATQSLPQHVPVQSWNQKDQWKTGWYSSFRPKQPWNKWKKESGSWGQQDTSHNIQEATPEWIKAAEQKKAAEKDSSSCQVPGGCHGSCGSNSAGAYPICRGWQRILTRHLPRQWQCALWRPLPHCTAPCDFAWHSGRMA